MLNPITATESFLRRRKGGGVTSLLPAGHRVGQVLLSYIDSSLTWAEKDARLAGHSNQWESREIGRILQKGGFCVDAISWMNYRFYPHKRYDAMLDIYINLQRLAPFFEPHTVKLLHLTGSYAPYQNAAEMSRVEAFEKRRGVLYSPKRLVSDIELYEKSLALADACSLIGNQHTLQTFPEKYRGKINLVTVSASQLTTRKVRSNFVPPEKEFVWFFGGGAVHKGLDLVIDVFAKNPQLTLNIIGNLEQEQDFLNAYQYELSELPNITYHGPLNPAGKKFNDVTSRVFCFIAPSCSESISTAVATCLQLGLMPIISRDTGIDLPDGCGIYLESCSVEEIEAAVLKVSGMDNDSLTDQIARCQQTALRQYSREKFSQDMTRYLAKVLVSLGKPL